MSQDIDQFISETLTALGQASPDVEAVMQMSPSRWVLSYTDDTQMDVALHEPTNRLVLSAEVGNAPEASRPRTMQALLAFNLMWAETDCVRAAMSPVDGGTILIADLFLPDMTDERLERAVLRLKDSARSWRDFVSGDLAAPVDAPDALMIRI